MQENEIEVRKIGLKTYIYMGIIIVLGIIFYMLAENGKVVKASKILHDLGYTKIENVRVYSEKQVEDTSTKIQGYRYFVKFDDLLTNQQCKGFILKDFKGKIAKDLECTKGDK